MLSVSIPSDYDLYRTPMRSDMLSATLKMLFTMEIVCIKCNCICILGFSFTRFGLLDLCFPSTSIHSYTFHSTMGGNIRLGQKKTRLRDTSRLLSLVTYRGESYEMDQFPIENNGCDTSRAK